MSRSWCRPEHPARVLLSLILAILILSYQSAAQVAHGVRSGQDQVGKSGQDAPPTVGLVNVWYPVWSAPNVEHPIAFKVKDDGVVESVNLIVEYGDQTLTSPLLNDGTWPGSVAGDSVYSGIIPGLPFGEIATYYAEATDNASQLTRGDMLTLDRRPVADVGSVILAVDRAGQFGSTHNPHNPFLAAGQWPGPDGFNYIFGGGLLVGMDGAAPRVMAAIDLKKFDPDWIPLSESYPVAGDSVSDSDFFFSFTDGGSEDPIGLQVDAGLHQWATGPASNGVVLVYEIINTTSENHEGLAAGLYLDPDIYVHPSKLGDADDVPGYDLDRGLIYVFDGGIDCHRFPGLGCPPTHVGMILLESAQVGINLRQPRPTGKTSLLPTTAVSWPSPGDFGRSFLSWMRSGIEDSLAMGQNKSVGDYRILIAPDKFDIPSGQKHRVAYALVFGDSPEDLGINADAIASAYEARSVAVEGDEIEERGGLRLSQNYPNPFHSTATVEYTLPKSAATVRILVVDMLGRVVQKIDEGPVPEGRHSLTLDAAGLATGVYVVLLETPNGSGALKVHVAK